jgi:hypothetical protein
VLLVHGDPTGSVLKRVVGRLLRTSPLVPSELVEACQNALKGPQSAAKKPAAPARSVRGTAGKQPPPRGLGGRRIAGRR